MYANTTGQYNVGIGPGALSSNTTASYNVAIGGGVPGALYASLGLNTTGERNVAVGIAASEQNTTGSYNVSVGFAALAKNTTASNNTAVGYQAAINNTTGSENTAVGTGALYSNQTGFFNTAIGRNAAYSSTAGGLTAVGEYTLVSTTTGIANVAMGGRVNSVSNAAMQANTTGSYNVAIGNGALTSNTTASYNTAVGYQAGYSTTTGTLNVFIGPNAGYSNTTDQGSVLIGFGAGYSANANTTSSDNTCVGSYAGYNMTTGSKNTYIGGSIQAGGAGYLMTTGSKNTILGLYNGNQGGLDIRTASNYIVLSDGDGNPVIAAPSQTEVLMRSGNGYWTLFSNGGGNSSAYNGTLIGANKGSLAGQANSTLDSWFIDIGGRAADGSTRPTSTSNKFSVGVQFAGGTIYNAGNVFEVNINGCVGLNTTAASSGTGITFPATQSASSNANTLDDYEEGTFTPVFTFGSGSATYGTQNGSYVKIGSSVTVSAIVVLTSVNTASGAMSMTLPFTSKSGTYYWTMSYTCNNIAWATNSYGIGAQIGSTSANLFFYNQINNGAKTSLDASQLQNTAELIFTVTYQTD